MKYKYWVYLASEKLPWVGSPKDFLMLPETEREDILAYLSIREAQEQEKETQLLQTLIGAKGAK